MTDPSVHFVQTSGIIFPDSSVIEKVEVFPARVEITKRRPPDFAFANGVQPPDKVWKEVWQVSAVAGGLVRLPDLVATVVPEHLTPEQVTFPSL